MEASQVSKDRSTPIAKLLSRRSTSVLGKEGENVSRKLDLKGLVS